MLKQLLLQFVHNSPDLTFTHTELLCERFKAYAINQTPFKDSPVSFAVDILIYQH